MNNFGWRARLADILREHNDRHARKDKCVSNLTKVQRWKMIFACFNELRVLKYKIEDPRNLKTKHVQALVTQWVDQGLAASTIQVRLSALRTFCSWIGKPGMVGKATKYVSDPERVKRTYAAQSDMSWTSRGVDIQKVLNAVAGLDPYVGRQLTAQFLFGMRVKESVCFKPHRDDIGTAIHIREGAKGGRERLVEIDSPLQREVLDEWKKLTSGLQSLSSPKHTLKQAMNRYRSIMRKAGINKKALGVTSHGLRKEFANKRYQDIAGEPSPIQGGEAIDREKDRLARVRVMHDLGHSREQISTAYIGAVVRPHSDSDPGAANDETFDSEPNAIGESKS